MNEGLSCFNHTHTKAYFYETWEFNIAEVPASLPNVVKIFEWV